MVVVEGGDMVLSPLGFTLLLKVTIHLWSLPTPAAVLQVILAGFAPVTQLQSMALYPVPDGPYVTSMVLRLGSRKEEPVMVTTVFPTVLKVSGSIVVTAGRWVGIGVGCWRAGLADANIE